MLDFCSTTTCMNHASGYVSPNRITILPLQFQSNSPPRLLSRIMEPVPKDDVLLKDHVSKATADTVPTNDSTAKSESTPTETQHKVSEGDVDDTTVFYNRQRGKVGPLTSDLQKKINKKNFWCLLSQTWWIAFLIHLDKSTLSQASTMGIFDDIEMSKTEYNNLFVVFYLGYLIALWPGGYVAQRVGHKHFINASLVLWALLLGLHLVVKTGKQMMALRFFLGMTESQIVPSTTVLHQAFFTPKKSPWVQLLWWASGSFANVLLTMVAYKLIEDDDVGALVGGLSSWKWLHIVCVILTFVVVVPMFYFLPNSPVDAKWLTTEEKVHTIAMIRETYSGIVNTTFKWDQ
ncbi:hypothetical protein E8E14_000022, partial [Neopestalotiopsis sp. 37M]